MGDKRDARVLDRFDDSPGDSLPRLVLAVMDTCHNQSPGQDLVGQVEAAAFRAIDFNSLEDSEASEPAVNRVDFFPLAEKLIGIRPPAMATRLEYRSWPDTRGLAAWPRQPFPRWWPPSDHVLGVQVAAEVLQPDQFRQRTGGGPFNSRRSGVPGNSGSQDGIDVRLSSPAIASPQRRRTR